MQFCKLTRCIITTCEHTNGTVFMLVSVSGMQQWTSQRPSTRKRLIILEFPYALWRWRGLLCVGFIDVCHDWIPRIKTRRTHSYYNKILHILPVIINKRNDKKMYNKHLQLFFSFFHILLLLYYKQKHSRDCRWKEYRWICPDLDVGCW